MPEFHVFPVLYIITVEIYLLASERANIEIEVICSMNKRGQLFVIYPTSQPEMPSHAIASMQKNFVMLKHDELK